MVVASSLQVANEIRVYANYGIAYQPKLKGASKFHSFSRPILPRSSVSSKSKVFLCHSTMLLNGANNLPVTAKTIVVLKRICSSICGSGIVLQLAPAIGIIGFAVWGLSPVLRLSRDFFLHNPETTWKKSGTHYVMVSYIQPFLLWTGAMLICRSLDPILLPSEASQVVKQRLLSFVKSLSTVLALAYCLSSLIQQTQKLFMEKSDPDDARNMGFQFAGNAVYTAVWVAAISLFMELLGFSTQKWLTAGGLGTVLLTLAGREIFTNFLSSVMIHATRPFVVNEWIQTKIEGYEVSGTVEHMGWWSPTIIRGDDREAVHIPNHKFTVNVVRNLSQKTHWRIKTHLAISHLDVSKINNIVADMRKVLAKNPQVEQQKLHRRVFLDYIDPENQALLILVSCFVKTSHFEEYLCVKEGILLDLLRVISHHRARLATPIRTIQKVYAEANENIPFSDGIFSHSRKATNRPFLLIDPSYKISADDRTKSSGHTQHTNEEKGFEADEASTAQPKSEVRAEESSTHQSKNGVKPGLSSTLGMKMDKNGAMTPSISSSNPTVPMMSPFDFSQNLSDDPTKNIFEKPPIVKADMDEKGGGNQKDTNGSANLHDPPLTSSGADTERIESPLASQSKHDAERSVSAVTQTRPIMEENLVLGVALEGSKRTLPIEEGMAPSPEESKELANVLNKNGSAPVTSDRAEDQPSNGPSVSTSDQSQEKESM